MTDAYRTSAFLCPVCGTAALREFHGRLVCDECLGMQLQADDFAESIREIDGSRDSFVIDDRGTAGACPQCKQPLATCDLTFGSMKLGGEGIMRCASHGLWIPRDVMMAAYARASRRGGFRGLGATGAATSRFGASNTSDAASVIANMPSAHSGMSSAMAGIASAFGAGGPASSGLAIGNWSQNRPRAHTLFVSAHKDLQLECPACDVSLAYHGDRWACGTCRGLFVENEAFVAMVREMALTAWELPAIVGTPGERACPICKTPMIVEVIEPVTIDRCDVHGVWFDDAELEQALYHVHAPPRGIGAWLKRLFR
jgi:ribosomal protein S27AE